MSCLCIASTNELTSLGESGADVQFAKNFIDDQFRSEGVNIRNINHDGTSDIVGELP
ncbi:MAG: hypothetical protein ACI8W8_004266 [Rhodothermales bacterium]|jgi:hypothetical protein